MSDRKEFSSEWAGEWVNKCFDKFPRARMNLWFMLTWIAVNAEVSGDFSSDENKNMRKSIRQYIKDNDGKLFKVFQSNIGGIIRPQAQYL
jgi:hypothetical protein